MALFRRQSLSELVAGQIKSLIIDNRLKTGDRLPTEQEMAKRFGVSRVSIREATKALSFLGIIRAAPRRGLTLGQVDMNRVTEYLGFHLALSDFPKLELLETRLVIETGALPSIARAMAADPALYESLRQGIDTELLVSDVEERRAGDIAFHRALLTASGVGPLLAFNDLLQIFFNRFEIGFTDQQWATINQQHVRLLECLRAGDLDGARDSLVQHLERYHRELRGESA